MVVSSILVAMQSHSFGEIVESVTFLIILQVVCDTFEFSLRCQFLSSKFRREEREREKIFRGDMGKIPKQSSVLTTLYGQVAYFLVSLVYWLANCGGKKNQRGCAANSPFPHSIN